METERKVCVIGGGPSGLLASLLLAKAGWQATLFERRHSIHTLSCSSPHVVRSSLSLTLNARGITALESAGIHLPSLKGVSINGVSWAQHGQVKATKIHQAGKLLCVRRSVLTETLVEKCQSAGVKIEFGSEIDAVSLQSVIREYDLVIGADGANSTVRNILWGHPEQGEERETDERGVWRELHSLCYAQVKGASKDLFPESGDMLFVGSSPLGFSMALPRSDDQSWDVGLYASEEVLRDSEQTAKLIEETLGSCGERSLATLASIEPLFTLRCNPIYCGNVVLLGDAASTRLPFLGCGANLALEDALELARHVEAFPDCSHLEFFSRKRTCEHRIACRLSKEEGDHFASTNTGNTLQKASELVGGDLFEAISFSCTPLSEIAEDFRAHIPPGASPVRVENGIKLYAKEGQQVNKGDIVGVLDSVKTRRLFRAKATGKIQTISFQNGLDLCIVPLDPTECQVNNQTHQQENVTVLMNSTEARLDGNLLQNLLTQHRVEQLGRFVSYRMVTGSTMDDAALEIQHGAPPGSLFLAEKQEKGRGRGGRVWKSDMKSNIYMSLVVKPFPGLAHAVPVSVCLALQQIGIHSACVKWPNDVLAGDVTEERRKISGMLVEVHEDANLAVVGIGINVFEQFDASTSLATSVKTLRPDTPLKGTRETILALICKHLEEMQRLQDASTIVSQFALPHSCVLGRTIIVTSKQGNETIHAETPEGKSCEMKVPFVCIAESLDLDGALVVALPSMTQEEVDGPRSRRKLVDSEASVSLAGKHVMIYCGPGSDERCREMTLHSLEGIFSSHKVICRPVQPWELVSKSSYWEDQCKLLVMPGGADIPMKKALGTSGQLRIKRFVKERQGRYLGFCAGAYFGSAKVEFDMGGPLQVDEPRILSFFPGTTSGPALPGFQYDSPRGAWACKLIVPALQQVEGQVFSYFNGGCRFTQTYQEPDLLVEPLASYAKDGTTAAVLCSFATKPTGGMAILCGAHPEFDPMFGDWGDETRNDGKLTGDTEDVPYGRIHQTLLEHDGSRQAFLQFLVQRLAL